MNTTDLLFFTASCGYISAQTAALRFANGFTETEVQRSFHRVKKQIAKAVKAGYLKRYSKDHGLIIFALTRGGAAHLHGQGFDNIKSTVKTAYDSQHVYHRLVADGFSLAMGLLASADAAAAGLKTRLWYERRCLSQSATFKMHFAKVPDSACLFGQYMSWIEVDTARKKATDMQRLLKFIKHGMCLGEQALAVRDLGNPQACLWVCSGAAFTNAVGKLKANFSDISGKKIDGGAALVIDSGSIQRPVVIVQFDFSSIADLHLRLVTTYKEAIEEALPCSI